MVILRRIGLFLIGMVLLAALLLWLLPKVAAFGLKVAGVDDVAFKQLDIGLWQTRIEQLDIGRPPSQRLASLEIDYSPGGLLSGQIDRVRIDGLYVKAAIADGAFRLAGDQSGDGSIPPMPVPKDVIIENSLIDLDTPLGPLTLPLSGRISAEDDHIDVSMVAKPARLDAGLGHLDASFEIEGQLPIDGTLRIDQANASGRLALQATNASLPGFLDRLDGGGGIDLELRDGVVSLSTDQPFVLNSENGKAKAKLSLDIELDEQLGLSRIERSDLSLDVTNVAIDGATLDTGRVDLSVSGRHDALNGTLALTLDGLDWSTSDVTLRGVRVAERTLALALDDHRLSLTPIETEAAQKISVDQVIVGDGMETGWFTIRWPLSDTPWLQLDLDEGRFEQTIEAEIDPVRIDSGSTRLWARIEDLGVSLTGDRDGLQSGKIVVKQGRADLPGANLAFTGIESEIALDGQDLVHAQAVPVTIRSIRPLEKPRWFAPVKLTAALQPEPKQLLVEGKVTSRAKPSARLDFSGGHDWESDGGSLDLKLPPLTFAPGTLQPADLSPGLEGVLENTTGRLALDGGISWQGNELDGDLALLIEELGFAIGPARLERINSVIRFDGIEPPSTLPGQLLSVGLLDVGLPLTDGLVSMQLRPDGRLAVDQLAWRFADGRVLADPFTFGSDVQDLTLMLKVDQLDLNGLLGLMPLDDLTGEGRIDGVLPLTIGEAAAAIDGGELAAAGPGVLRYKPKEAPGVLQAGGESVRVMLQALENFKYDALRISLDGRTDGAMDIGLHLKGANPELYEGHPVEFNLNLEGNLASLIQTNLDNYQIPDRIRERLQRFGR